MCDGSRCTFTPAEAETVTLTDQFMLYSVRGGAKVTETLIDNEPDFHIWGEKHLAALYCAQVAQALHAMTEKTEVGEAD